MSLVLSDNIRLANSEVKVDNLDASLTSALETLGSLHRILFGAPLVLTAGSNGTHSAGSKHYKNLAVDVRSWDKTEAGQVVWGAVLAYLALKLNLAAFDERARDKSPHWHIEVAD